jgi:hypothetical protein
MHIQAMVIDFNMLDSLHQYLIATSDYNIEEMHIDEAMPVFAPYLPEKEDFRVKVKGSLDDAIAAQDVLVQHIRDFYEIEHGGTYHSHGNGTMSFDMHRGVISVVTTAVKDEVRVSATNYCSEYAR